MFATDQGGLSSLSTPCSLATVTLHSITTDGAINSSPLATTTLNADGTFIFTNMHSISLSENNLSYVIKASGCGQTYYRPLTSQSGQAVTEGGTLLTFTGDISDSGKVKLNQMAKASAVSLISALDSVSASTLTARIDAAMANASVNSLFLSALNIAPSKLKEIPPVSLSVTASLAVSESTATLYSSNPRHWNAIYDSAYQWSLNGQIVSTSATWTYHTTKNAQGSQNVELVVGVSQAGLIDFSKPTKSVSMVVVVSDSYPASAPAISLTGVSPRNFLVGSLSMATGALLQNCDTFSTLALTEDHITPPLSASTYNITCNQSAIQTIPFTLTAGDGVRNLALWARDAAGNISTTPRSINLVLDQMGPQISLGSMPSLLKGGQSIDVTFAAFDATAGLDNLNLEYAVDGVSFVTVATVSASPFSWSVPFANTNLAKLRLTATDLATNSSQVESLAFTIDSTTPSVSLTSLNAGGVFASGSNQNITWTASDINLASTPINLHYSCSSGSSWTEIASNLSNTASPYSWQLPAIEANCVVRVSAVDSLGHSSSATSQMQFAIDHSAPSVTLTSMNSGFYASGASQTITWSVRDNHLSTNPITLEYSTDNGTSWNVIATSLQANGNVGVGTSTSSTVVGSYVWTIPFVDSTTARVRVTALDVVGHATATQSANVLTLESSLPNVTSFILNSGVGTTINSNVLMAFQATSTQSKLQKICIKNSSTKPTVLDPCWTNLNTYSISPAQTIQGSIYYNIGLTSGVFTFYTWVMTEAQNISDLSSAGMGVDGIDKGSLTYITPLPPQILGFQAVSSDNPNTPPTDPQLVAAIGQDIFLQWSVSATALTSQPITISQSLDDITFTPLTGGANLINGVNGACTIHPGYTGCARLVSSTSAYYKLKIRVVDSLNNIAFSISNPLNAFPVKLLAGNTDLGLGGSAKAAILKPKSGFTLSVLDDGRIFLADQRGLGWVNPNTGIYEILIPQNGVISGNGGPAASATLRSLTQVRVDFQQNILLVDHNVIRKINTHVNPMTITTILGGGASSADTVVGALNFQATSGSYGPLYIFPNGDIWFWSDASGGAGIRTYHSNTDTITRLYFSGIGNSFSSTQDNALCGFDGGFVTFDSNSVADQLVWKIRSTSNYQNGIPGACHHGNTNEWRGFASLDPISGTAILPAAKAVSNNANSQNIASGYRDFHQYYLARSGDIYTLYSNPGRSNSVYKFDKITKDWLRFAGSGAAGSCADGTLESACALSAIAIDINSQGQFFYIDKVANSIRTIDNSGRIRTLAGDSLGSENGVAPLAARFVGLTDVKVWSKNGIDQIMAFDYADSRIRGFLPGASMTTIAGSQVCAISNTSASASTQAIMTCADSNPRRLLVDQSNGDIYAYRGAGRLLSRINQRTDRWEDVATFSEAHYGPSPLGISASGVILGSQAFGGAVHLFTRQTPSVSTIIWESGSVTGQQTNFCIDGSSLQNCKPANSLVTGLSSAEYDSVTDKWLMPNGNDGRIVAFNQLGGGQMSTLATLPRAARDIKINRSPDLATNVIYYCAVNSKLYKYNLNSATETELPFLNSTMACSGPIFYSAERSSLVFVYSQNGLHGVAEYLNP